MIIGIDHVQITVPAHAVDDARAFYCRLLGLREIEKPESLRARGGFWLEVGDRQGTSESKRASPARRPRLTSPTASPESVHGVRGSQPRASRFSMASRSPGAIASSSGIRSATASS
jgi:catechol 2,3-dioxygenase-like lactoylglutathione lyase family enzyme